MRREKMKKKKSIWKRIVLGVLLVIKMKFKQGKRKTFNRIRQVAKRIANIRLTKQKKTDTWQIVRMPVSCFYLLVFQKRSVIMLRFRSSLHELLTVLFERPHREFQLLQRKSHLLLCTERKLPGRKPGSCFLLQ